MPKKGGEGPKGFKWHNSRPPEEIANQNAEIGAKRWLERAEKNRKKLLEGISANLIAVTREKAEKIISQIKAPHLTIAESMIDNIVRTQHPKEMISTLHSQPEEIEDAYAINTAAVAMAFLALTEE